MNYTERVEALAKELGIKESVAMDIIHLRDLEARLIKVAKEYPSLWDYPVYNERLEEFLSSMEQSIK